ncbi:meiosis inhibitor protein 1 isoform X2 [Trichomycterus rosablanca]
MAGIDVIYEKIHHRHNLRWTVNDRTCNSVCIACVIELIDTKDVSVVRKSVALTGVGELLKTEGLMKEVLQQDERICVHFISSLQKMLQCVEDPAVLEKVIHVLVQLLLDLKTDEPVQQVLDELQTQLCDGKAFLPCVTLLGKLLESIPAVSQIVSTKHLCVWECVCARMWSSDEDLKSAGCYVLRAAWESEATLRSLPHALRDRACVLVLHTLTHACKHQLTVNCLGLLLAMLRSGETVCFLINLKEETQCAELQHSTLPLVLKRLLLGADESLQVASVQCACAVLNHSTQYCSHFIQADIPEFLFERMNSCNEVLLWCVYRCVRLLTEDALFFSQCHSVYGIESLVRSLKTALKLSNLEVVKQGLQLLTAILDKQPSSVRLFPIGEGFVGVADVMIGGMASSCFRVATQAARTATALLKRHHQSTPVHYGELKKIIEAVSSRFKELPSRTISHRRRCFAESESGASVAGAFLIQALTCFQEACRLAEECVSEAGVKESTLTQPEQKNEHTLESVCVCLLHCCDTVYIPAVTRMSERSPSPQVLQLFLSVLSLQFSLSPAMMPTFSSKLASSGFIRLVVENKALLCSGNRHTSLNAACSHFLLKLCTCLINQPHPVTCSQHQGVEEVECVLQECLPSLCCRPCDWSSALAEVPAANQNAQYCLLHLLYLSLLHGDRMLPDAAVFSSVGHFMCSVQEERDDLPQSVLQSVLYLLSVTQDSSPDLDWAPLNSISKALSSTPASSSPLSSPHPSLLRFIFRYPELAERFGATLLAGWMKNGAEPSGKDPDVESSVLLELLEKSPATVLTMLAAACELEEAAGERLVDVIKCFLSKEKNCDSAPLTQIKQALLQLLQKLTCDSSTVPHCASLVLKVLCVIQKNSTAHTDMDHTDFKLLYHVSNLVGKVKCSNTDYLLPALNYLYCCLVLSPTHTADRVVSMLLCNTGLMELLQTLLNLSHSSSSSSSSYSCSSSSLLSCSLLLLSSLITLQHTHSAQVHKSVCLEFESVVRTLAFFKRHTDSLLLVCTVRLVQVLLDVDLCSPVVGVSEYMELHPLGHRGALSLVTALQSLLLQKQEMLMNACVNCLNSLIIYLHRMRPAIVQHVVCQPWNRFLLYSLLNSGENLILHPATLCLLKLLIHWCGDGVRWEADVIGVCDAAERRGFETLDENSIHTLSVLLTE